ncbi:hypothetical protein [Amycolatopsis jiangsuensis]|uniref:Uncharacterized protein n=1 Tax=Amycolatopsis jiangsuensis TaxID=1181879 RepID=A0A840ITV3_9PSEU|nr:hypothetical protein [Amycolatopsis jiangsuensis]MBB4685223.1 hypothetical protein [Amycolatopsis jiangsuensis]
MVGQFESSKDTVQELTESAAGHIGAIATIITGAVRDIARETGDWFTDLIEMREAAARARADEPRHPAAPEEPDLP